MPEGKYAIWKCSDEGVWFPRPPTGRWVLCFPNGTAKIFPTWDAAIQAGWHEGARHAAVQNRIALGPIGVVTHA